MNDNKQKVATALRTLVAAIYNDSHQGIPDYYNGRYEAEIQAVAGHIVGIASTEDHKKDVEKAILNNPDPIIWVSED